MISCCEKEQAQEENAVSKKDVTLGSVTLQTPTWASHRLRAGSGVVCDPHPQCTFGAARGGRRCRSSRVPTGWGCLSQGRQPGSPQRPPRRAGPAALQGSPPLPLGWDPNHRPESVAQPRTRTSDFLAQRQQHSQPNHPELIIFKLHLLKARMSRRVGGNRESRCSNHLHFSDSFTALISSRLCTSPLSSNAQLSCRRCGVCFGLLVAFWIRRVNGLRKRGKEHDLPRALAESESKPFLDRALGLT